MSRLVDLDQALPARPDPHVGRSNCNATCGDHAWRESNCQVRAQVESETQKLAVRSKPHTFLIHDESEESPGIQTRFAEFEQTNVIG